MTTATDAGCWRLLSTATFFEGYDNFVLSFVLALVLVDLGGTEAQAGPIRAIVGLGAPAGFLLFSRRARALGPHAGLEHDPPRLGGARPPVSST